MAEDIILTRKETASKLKISLSTLDRLVKREKIPAYKLGGGTVRFKESDVTIALSNNKKCFLNG